MPEVEPESKRSGYQHPDIVRAQAVLELLDRLPEPVVPDRAEMADHWRRELSAHSETPLATVRHYPSRGMTTLWLDERTAAVLVYAGQLMAFDYEAHAFEVRRVADDMVHGSWGANNRLEIAQRRERVAGRLRVVERAYREAVSREYHGI